MSNNDSKVLLDKAVFNLIQVISNYPDDNVTEEEAIGVVTELIDNLRLSINSESQSLLGRCIRIYREKQL